MRLLLRLLILLWRMRGLGKRLLGEARLLGSLLGKVGVGCGVGNWNWGVLGVVFFRYVLVRAVGMVT